MVDSSTRRVAAISVLDRPRAAAAFDRLAAVRRLVHDDDGFADGEYGAQPGPHEVVVAGDQDPQRAHGVAVVWGSEA